MMYSFVVGVTGYLFLRHLSHLIPAANDCKDNETTNIAPIVWIHLVDCTCLQQLNDHEFVVVVTCIARHSSNQGITSDHRRGEYHHGVKELEGQTCTDECTGHISSPEKPNFLECVEESLIQNESEHETAPSSQDGSSNLDEMSQKPTYNQADDSSTGTPVIESG